MTVKALIADDERLARNRIRRMLAGHDWLETVAETNTGPETATRIDELRPDVVFLDVQMPGLLGTEVPPRIRHRPLLVFMTAHRDHAVTAFDLRALDFLLKPFDQARVDEALERLRQALAPDAPQAQASRADDDATHPPARIFIRRLGALLPVVVDDILRLEADGEYVAVHTAEGSHHVHSSLTSLAARLSSERFVRIHRSHFVNLDHVRAFRPHDGVRLRAELRDGSAVVASRRASRTLRGRGV